jgi:hypothetical protein
VARCRAAARAVAARRSASTRARASPAKRTLTAAACTASTPRAPALGSEHAPGGCDGAVATGAGAW